MTEEQPSYETVDAHVKQVAALLPFPVELDADMGGAFVLQIDLGQRGGVDDPHDTAGIDHDDLPTPRWWVDIEGGERTYVSDFGLDTDPAEVAAWIARTAHEEQCPAAVDGDMRRRNAIVAASHPPNADRAPATVAATPAEPSNIAPSRQSGHER